MRKLNRARLFQGSLRAVGFAIVAFIAFVYAQNVVKAQAKNGFFVQSVLRSGPTPTATPTSTETAKEPQSADNIPKSGYYWDNATAVTSCKDGTNAYVEISPAEKSDYLWMYDFNFESEIPSDAHITGLKIAFIEYNDELGVSTSCRFNYELLYGGPPGVGTPLGPTVDAIVPLDHTPQTYTFGDGSSMQGFSFTAGDLDGNFGVSFFVENQEGVDNIGLKLNCVTLTIYWYP